MTENLCVRASKIVVCGCAERGVPNRYNFAFSVIRVEKNLSMADDSTLPPAPPPPLVRSKSQLAEIETESVRRASLAFADDAFCGFGDAPTDRQFNEATQHLIEYRRSPFCYEDGISVPPYSQCCHPRKPGDAFFPCVFGFDPPEPLPACGRDRAT